MFTHNSEQTQSQHLYETNTMQMTEVIPTAAYSAVIKLSAVAASAVPLHCPRPARSRLCGLDCCASGLRGVCNRAGVQVLGNTKRLCN